MRISRHFLYVKERAVHFRRCGHGPALVLLHASPVSSRVFLEAMPFWGRHFTCFAFDTPGNGLSDPLPGEGQTIADYADAQVEALRLLGIDSCIVYGRHTGASIAVEIARRHPSLITLALTDGYPVFTPEQRKAYLSGYLPDLPISEDGSHVAWLWSRYRDQFVFWPWSKRSVESRADCDMPDVGFLNDGVIALLEAGNHYKGPYSAVFRHDAMETLDATRVPVCIAARPGDSLYYQLSRFSDAHWKVEMPRDAGLAMQRELEIMLEYKPVPDAPAPPAPESALRRRAFVDSGTEYLHLVTAGDPGRPVTVLIGPAPGEVLRFTGLLDTLAESHRVIGIDPACGGDSDAPADDDVSMQAQARRVAAALQALGVARCRLAAVGPSAGIALELARQGTPVVDALVLIDPLTVDDSTRARCVGRYASDVSPRLDGTHMLALWHRLRDSMMWFPWFEQRRSAARPPPATGFAFDRLERDFAVALKHCRHYRSTWRAAWDYPLRSRLENAGGSPVEVLHSEDGLVPAVGRIPAQELGQRLCSTFERLAA